MDTSVYYIDDNPEKYTHFFMAKNSAELSALPLNFFFPAADPGEVTEEYAKQSLGTAYFADAWRQSNPAVIFLDLAGVGDTEEFRKELDSAEGLGFPAASEADREINEIMSSSPAMAKYFTRYIGCFRLCVAARSRQDITIVINSTEAPSLDEQYFGTYFGAHHIRGPIGDRHCRIVEFLEGQADPANSMLREYAKPFWCTDGKVYWQHEPCQTAPVIAAASKIAGHPSKLTQEECKGFFMVDPKGSWSHSNDYTISCESLKAIITKLRFPSGMQIACTDPFRPPCQPGFLFLVALRQFVDTMKIDAEKPDRCRPGECSLTFAREAVASIADPPNSIPNYLYKVSFRYGGAHSASWRPALRYLRKHQNGLSGTPLAIQNVQYGRFDASKFTGASESDKLITSFAKGPVNEEGKPLPLTLLNFQPGGFDFFWLY